MTWPFENDTSAIVKKLADRSMKADKRRNAFIIITIAFAVSLMMVLALYNLGTDRENRLYLQGRYQSSFINSTSTVFEKLEHNNQIESVGKEAAMGTSRINDYTLDVYYRDQNALELKGVTDLLGKMPEAENEIIVEQSYLEHLGLPVELDGDTVDQKFLDEIVHLLGLEDKLKNMPNNLSGGQQQRVAIARALITKPAIVLADEPTGNLDSKTSAEVLGLIKRTSAEFRQTVVMITHNDDIARLADRIVRIEDGKIVE